MGGRISIEVKWQNQVTHALNIFNHNKRKGDFIMKKILSIILCLALAFSVCSFTLTANASSKTTSDVYMFDSLRISVKTTFSKGGDISRIDINFCERNEEDYYNPSIVTEYGTGDLEYIVEDFLLERLTDYQITKIVLLSFDRYLGVESRLDEYDYAYIISKLNPSKLKYCVVINDNIDDMSPIVDALLGCCKNTLSSFEINGKTKITEVDNRIFTDFPKMETVILRGIDIWSYNSEAKLMRDVYDMPCFYAVVSIDEEINVVYGQYKYDLASYLYDYYYDNISQYFVGADNITVQVEKAGEHVQVETFYNYNGIKALIGEEIDGYVVYEGDATGDGFTDAFDVATATEYVNNFEEPEDPAVKMAMDVVADGYIDATDLAYVSYIANFEG